MILAFCDRSYIVEILLIVKTFFKLACYIVPPIIIIVTIVNITKTIISGKDDDLKDNWKLLVKRLIAGLLIMFLPTIINYVFTGIVDASEVEFLSCFESASKEKVQALKQKEEAEEAAKEKQQEKEDEAQLRKAYEEEQKIREGNKESFEEWKKRKEAEEQQSNGGNVEVTTGGVTAEAFKNKLSSMSTPTMSQLESAAAKNNISTDYLKVVIGTTFNEGYYNDPYLYYGWASAMINNPVSIQQMQGWDPGHTGESNFYSQTNINKGFNSATDDVLKSVYLALTERNTKIVECNGMYQTTPSSYNLLYSSSVYNCSIYETK